MSKQIAAAAATFALAGCWTGPAKPTAKVVGNTPPPASSPAAPDAGGPLMMTDAGAGALPANVAVSMLPAKMPGYEIVHADDAAFPDFGPGPHLNVLKDHERLFVVVIHGDEVFNVHTDNPKIGVKNHPAWHAGATFTEANLLSRCECWGGNNVCWVDGEHAALAFERTCQETIDERGALKVMNGLPIKRLVWNPLPFGPDKDAPPTTTAPKGGGLTGNVHIHPNEGGPGDGADDPPPPPDDDGD